MKIKMTFQKTMKIKMTFQKTIILSGRQLLN